MADLSYEQWLDLRCQLIWCYDRGDVPHSHMPVQYREPPMAAWLVRRGWIEAKGQLPRPEASTTDGQTTTWQLSAGPGEWLLVPAGPREQRYHPHCALLSIAFEANWPDGNPWFGAQSGLPVFPAQRFPSLEAHALPMARLAKRIMGEDWHLPSYPLSAAQFTFSTNYFIAGYKLFAQA